MLCGDRIIVYLRNYEKYTNILCGRKAKFCNDTSKSWGTLTVAANAKILVQWKGSRIERFRNPLVWKVTEQSSASAQAPHPKYMWAIVKAKLHIFLPVRFTFLMSYLVIYCIGGHRRFLQNPYPIIFIFAVPTFPAPVSWRVWILHHHHHHMSVMELGHLLTRSGLTYREVSSEVCHDSFCQLGNSVSLSWVVCHRAFCLHVVSSSFVFYHFYNSSL